MELKVFHFYVFWIFDGEIILDGIESNCQEDSLSLLSILIILDGIESLRSRWRSANSFLKIILDGIERSL